MKTLFKLFPMVFLLATAPLFAQKMRDVRPEIMPKKVIEAFRTRHPNAFIKKWSNSMIFPAHFVVDYNDSEQPFRERYRMDGLLLGTSKIYHQANIPGKWLSRARSDYPNRNITSAVYVVDMHEPKDKKTYWFVRLKTMGKTETVIYNSDGAKVDKEKIGFVQDEIGLKDD